MFKCLAKCLRMSINIILINSDAQKHQNICYEAEQNEKKPVLNVYFRPGHYDLIYNYKMVDQFYGKELQKVFVKKEEEQVQRILSDSSRKCKCFKNYIMIIFL